MLQIVLRQNLILFSALCAVPQVRLHPCAARGPAQPGCPLGAAPQPIPCLQKGCARWSVSPSEMGHGRLMRALERYCPCSKATRCAVSFIVKYLVFEVDQVLWRAGAARAHPEQRPPGPAGTCWRTRGGRGASVCSEQRPGGVPGTLREPERLHKSWGSLALIYRHAARLKAGRSLPAAEQPFCCAGVKNPTSPSAVPPKPAPRSGAIRLAPDFCRSAGFSLRPPTPAPPSPCSVPTRCWTASAPGDLRAFGGYFRIHACGRVRG